MKTFNRFLAVSVVVVSLGVFCAQAGGFKPVTVQYGQGGAVTFFQPSVPAASSKPAQVANQPVKVKWAQQAVPNGAPVGYSVQETPALEIAPLK